MTVPFALFTRSAYQASPSGVSMGMGLPAALPIPEEYAGLMGVVPSAAMGLKFSTQAPTWPQSAALAMCWPPTAPEASCGMSEGYSPAPVQVHAPMPATLPGSVIEPPPVAPPFNW